MERDLYELAEFTPMEWPEVAASGEITGVAMPETGPIAHGAILTPDYARKLGARLILAADAHDAIYERGVTAFEAAERHAHDLADNLAQRTLGNLEPKPGESPMQYDIRARAAEEEFRKERPEWQPERFNRYHPEGGRS